jgi:hypothetical protein
MDNVQNILGINSADNMFDSTLIVANKDGSIIERLEYLQGSPIQERCIEKSDGGVLNGADPLFTITGGPILVTSIVGIVTTVIAGGAVNGTLQATTTEPAATVALSTTVAITDDAAGTSYRFVGAGGVLTPDTNGAKIIDPVTVGDCAFLIPIGNINFLGSAARTGNIKWYMIYKPLSPNSVVTVAV